MVFNFMDHTSIIVDSICMCFLSCLFIAITAMKPHVDVLRFNVGVMYNLVVILAIIACAYGIPISKVRKGYARKFAITASVFGVLSIVVSVINAIISRVTISRNYEYESIETAVGSTFGTIVEVVVDFAAILMTVKYIRTCVLLTREQRAQSRTALPPPHVLAVQGNVYNALYPSQPAAQPMMVGPPIYRPS